uniref:Uncharacterized protein n=1 Tax=Astatotilapia calliptera TaxID=8154 RepID=A0AAX7VKC3_ASTCA
IFGTFLNDLLTPAVRFSPWVTPLLGPIAPMVSSDNGRGLTGIPHTSSNQPKFVFFICDLLLFNISPREEKPHHSFEELVHQLDGERHHIHLMMKTKYYSVDEVRPKRDERIRFKRMHARARMHTHTQK